MYGGECQNLYTFDVVCVVNYECKITYNYIIQLAKY